jgi:hypothetical protein
MDKQEAQEVVNETVSGLVGGYILALMVIAALPIVGWALLFGLAGIIAAPGVAALAVAGLIVWGWVGSMCRAARGRQLKRAEEARLASLKASHGGKDRYFVREGYTIKLMSLDPGSPYLQADYGWAGSYNLVPRDRRYGDMHPLSWDMHHDPKRLERWQAVFEDWIETGVKPSQDTWWMFPDEAAQYEEREAERQQRLKMAVCPENSLTHS